MSASQESQESIDLRKAMTAALGDKWMFEPPARLIWHAFQHGLRERAITGEPVAEKPFLFAIKSPDGEAHMDEGCVSTAKGDLQDAVFYLNEDRDAEDGLYEEVALYLRAAPITGETSRDVAAEGGSPAPVQSTRDTPDANPLPWDDCKVAFGCDNEEKFWSAHKFGKLALPHGWSVYGTDSSGARSVILFRVEGALWPEDGDRVKSMLRRVGVVDKKNIRASS